MGRGSGLTRRRSYNQRDLVAGALDVVGDRWTLLIVRELMLGPRRWSDLLANLDGIGKNLLSARLRELDNAGLVTTAVLPWSSSRTRLYSLTEKAAPLQRVVLELARLGTAFVPAHRTSRPEWAAIALAVTEPRAAEDVVHAQIDGASFTIWYDGDGVRIARGIQGAATLTRETSSDDVFDRLEAQPNERDRR